MQPFKFYNKTPLFLIVLFNFCLIITVVFLMNHVQNLLNSDAKINLTEIVTQNKNVITSKIMMDINSLDVTANKISEGLKARGVVDANEIKALLGQYAKPGESNALFVANKDGIALASNGQTIDISGRRYFKLAIDGVASMSDRIISRISGEEIFVASVPLYYQEEIIGTIQKIYTPDEMDSLFSLTLFSSLGYMYVIDSEGYMILHSSHTDCHRISDNYFRDIHEYGNKEAAEQIKADIANNRSGFIEVDISDNKIFSAYTPIEQIHDWYLITSVPINVVSPNGNIVIQLFYFILMFVVLIFTSSIFYFSWYKNKQRINLEKIAFFDTVTGGNTYNKFFLDVQTTLTDAPSEQFYIVKFDIDNFKYINNYYGFEFGDRVLHQIYQKAFGSLRPGETIARVSSDHFVALLKDVDENRLDSMIGLPETDESPHIYFSAGIYEVLGRDESINLMVDKASIAALSVKGSLNQKYAYYSTDYDKQTAENEQLKRKLKQAIQCDEFVAFFQPKVNIETGRLVGAEALARWITKDNQFISPGAFIPLCEKTGFIMEVDMIIFEKTLAFLKKNLDADIPCVPISVNFSRIHLSDPKFIDKVLERLQRYQVPANLVEIELTESAIFDNVDTIYEFTKSLHTHGLVIAMDDFGSGYSSLNMLKDIPIDVLKIDRGFLKEAADNDRRNIIFASIVKMAKELHINIVVEGVEFIENVELMQNCGCNIAQGFYFAKPMKPQDFETIFKEGTIR